MKRVKWAQMTMVLVLCFGTGLYVMAVRSYYQDMAPPSGIRLEELSKHAVIARIRELEKQGSVFYMVEGQSPPSYVLASGPPVYVFDSKGHLVEWISDSGDQPSRMDKWRILPSREIPLDRAVRDINGEDTG